MAVAALLLVLISTILLASALGQRSYDLTFRRLPNDINRILLVCVDASNGELVLDASFFRNGVLYTFSQGAVIPRLGVRFVVDRSSEGNFTCGEVGRTRSPGQTIVGE